MVLTGLPQVRRWSEEKILRGQGIKRPRCRRTQRSASTISRKNRGLNSLLALRTPCHYGRPVVRTEATSLVAREQAHVGAQARIEAQARAKSSPDSFPPDRFSLRRLRSWLKVNLPAGYIPEVLSTHFSIHITGFALTTASSVFFDSIP